MRGVFLWLGPWLLLGGAAMAGMERQPWEKPLEQWSRADVRRILSDSPWARSATVTVRGYRGSSKKFRRNDSSSLTPGRVTIRLESALPVRLALVKAGVTPAADDGPGRNCIAVVEFPANWTRYSPMAGDWRDAQAWLEPAGAAPIPASEVRLMERSDNASALVFVFAADGGLLSPRVLRFPFLKRNLKTFDLRAEAGLLEIEHRFSAAAMTFQGNREF